MNGWQKIEAREIFLFIFIHESQVLIKKWRRIKSCHHLEKVAAVGAVATTTPRKRKEPPHPPKVIVERKPRKPAPPQSRRQGRIQLMRNAFAKSAHAGECQLSNTESRRPVQNSHWVSIAAVEAGCLFFARWHRKPFIQFNENNPRLLEGESRARGYDLYLVQVVKCAQYMYIF